jgi:pimeloyl-ACP methyl ester carboxylesterase
LETSAFFPFRSAGARTEYLALIAERAKSWPVASETKLIVTPSGQTFMRLSGNPADPPLVLLPGSRDNSLTWFPNIASFSAHYRTYALDSIYDVGLSISHRKIKKADDLVNWLDEVLAVLVPEGSIRLVGLSYGGWLASQYALRFPHRVQKLGLLAPAATLLPVSFPFLIRALSLLLPGTFFIKSFLYWLLQDTARSGETGQAIVEQAVADWVITKRCFGPLPLIAATVIPDQDFEAFQVSTLYLDGEHEKVYSAQKAVMRLNRVAPQIQTEIIPRAGHDLWIAQAELVNQKLLQFLGEP